MIPNFVCIIRKIPTISQAQDLVELDIQIIKPQGHSSAVLLTMGCRANSFAAAYRRTAQGLSNVVRGARPVKKRGFQDVWPISGCEIINILLIW
jgi:hypothetical protein